MWTATAGVVLLTLVLTAGGNKLCDMTQLDENKDVEGILRKGTLYVVASNFFFVESGDAIVFYRFVRQNDRLNLHIKTKSSKECRTDVVRYAFTEHGWRVGDESNYIIAYDDKYVIIYTPGTHEFLMVFAYSRDESPNYQAINDLVSGRCPGVDVTSDDFVRKNPEAIYCYAQV